MFFGMIAVGRIGKRALPLETAQAVYYHLMRFQGLSLPIEIPNIIPTPKRLIYFPDFFGRLLDGHEQPGQHQHPTKSAHH
jgi:hypothetical protein